MGIIPDTGSEIAMGRIYKALTNNTAAPGDNITLNGTLGGQRDLAVTPISAIPSGTTTNESSDFGGLTTPHDY